MTTTPFRFIVQDTDERAGLRTLDLLSVSIDRGVYPRSETTDAEPRAEDLGNYKVCIRGDIVLNRMRAFQGALGLAQQDGLVSPDYAVLRTGVQVDASFLAYTMRSRWFVGQMTARLRGIGDPTLGSVRTPRVNIDDLGDIAVPTPSPEEQRRIADFLDDRVARIDQIITARRQQRADLEERFAGARRSVLIESPGPTRASGLPWAPQVPKQWPVRRLAQLARMGTGHTPSRSQPEYWLDCHIPWLTTGDVHRFRHDEIDVIHDTAIEISELGLANSAAVLHPQGTVALSRTASAGFSILMGQDMATSQDFVTWTCGPQLLPDYLLHVLRVMRPFLLGYLAPSQVCRGVLTYD